MKQIELVILLNGNFCVIPLQESELTDAVTLVRECMTKGFDDPKFFINYKGYFLLAKNIVGFYVRKPVENKAGKLVDKLLNQMDEGEDWRG